jgi:hypothetical protein
MRAAVLTQVNKPVQFFDLEGFRLLTSGAVARGVIVFDR